MDTSDCLCGAGCASLNASASEIVFHSSLLFVGLDGLEPSTSVLSGLRSNQLSYRPVLTGTVPN